MSCIKSVQKRTKTWLLAYFMNLISLDGLNSFILYIHKFPLKMKELAIEEDSFAWFGISLASNSEESNQYDWITKLNSKCLHAVSILQQI